jgi:hypothetical protein
MGGFNRDIGVGIIAIALRSAIAKLCESSQPLNAKTTCNLDRKIRPVLIAFISAGFRVSRRLTQQAGGSAQRAGCSAQRWLLAADRASCWPRHHNICKQCKCKGPLKWICRALYAAVCCVANIPPVGALPGGLGRPHVGAALAHRRTCRYSRDQPFQLVVQSPCPRSHRHCSRS